MTINLHKGFGPLSRKFKLNELKLLIQKTEADFVFLQEVVGSGLSVNHQVGGEGIQTSQFEFLADQVWAHFAYGRNAVYSERHHGNAILSRFPMVSFENINISNYGLEKRGLLHAVAQDPISKQSFELLCVHTDLTERGRQQQLQKICDRIKRAVNPERPLLLCGDFNDWRLKASSVLSKNLSLDEAFNVLKGHHAKTFPSFLPVLRLDRIYFRNLEASVAQTLNDFSWRATSDHLGLICDFKY